MKKRLGKTILILIFLFLAILFLLFFGFIPRLSLEALIILLFAMIFYFYYSRQSLLRRIEKLCFEIEEIAAGNLAKKIKLSQKDELGQLVNVLNELTGRLRTGVVMDISKNKEIDQAKADFVSLASHHLRTPLSIIKWYIDFLLSGDAGDINPEQRRYLREVYRANERLIELVNALLDVSRVDMGTFAIEPRPVDLIKIADDVLRDFLPQIKEKNLVFEKKYDKLPLLNLDPRLIKIVFKNLISNSVKYTLPGGTIRITIKRSDPNVLIKVSDTGCGIPRDQHPKVFKKLFRADNVKNIEPTGTGLGLYITKAIIEKSGGKIWFESPSLELLLEKNDLRSPIDEKRRGTTFFITIPLKGMKRKKGNKKLGSA